MNIIESRCMSCKWPLGFPLKTCMAFPDGIPDEIWEGKNDHSRPYLGDNEIIFKSKWED